jgi:putative nucleotidyltransferase with HDIG domain
VGNPEERFSEDGLRPMRALRFASQLGFSMDEGLLAAIPGALPLSVKVAPERIREELDKIIASDKPSTALVLMEKTGLLALLIPELAVCRGIEQKGFHEFDVLDHSLIACDYSAQNSYSHNLRLAALLHDIGKPLVRQLGEGGVWTFYRHEEKSASIAKKILNRLRYSNSVIDNVCHLISEHMFLYTSDWTNAAVRRFIARVGETNLKDIFSLRRADVYAFSGKDRNSSFLAELIDRTEKTLAKGRAFAIKDLAINGKDLMAIGVPAGKAIGLILRELLETVLDDPEQNTKEKLLEIAKNIVHERYA